MKPLITTTASKAMIATAALQEGDDIFIIIKRQEIKRAKFFGETGCNDGSVWVVLPEHWDGDRESLCFCCQAYQWAASYSEARNRLKEALLRQKRELVNEINAIDSILTKLSDPCHNHQ